MIEEFVKGYTIEIESKNAEISDLKRQLFKDSDNYDPDSFDVSNFSALNPSEADKESHRRMSLDVIQEVSECTGSVGQTIRQSETAFPTAQNSSFPMFSTENCNSER